MMSKDNEQPKKPEPVPVHIAAHASIMTLYKAKEAAQSRLELAVTILRQQLGLQDTWEYDTNLKAFVLPPKRASAKTRADRVR